MVKYTNFDVVFEEIPDKITLAVNISNCQCNCKGCHSSYLRKNIGTELSIKEIDNKMNYLLKNCNCFLFLGEGNDIQSLLMINDYIKKTYNIETAIYSGREQVEDFFYDAFDYVKIGPYIEEYGSINNPTTNQKLFYHKENITNKFWNLQK